MPWEFFDGAAQGDPKIFGGGAVLHINKNHSFRMKMGLGEWSNNYSKLMLLKLLLVFALEKNITSLHIYGVSQLNINWTKGVKICYNLILQPLLNDITHLKLSYSSSSISHIYKQLNTHVDDLSKEVVLLASGT